MDSASRALLSTVLSWSPEGWTREVSGLRGRWNWKKLCTSHVSLSWTYRRRCLSFPFLSPHPFYFPFPELDGLTYCVGEGKLRFVWPPARAAYVTAIFHLPRREAMSPPIPKPDFIVNDILLLQDTKLPGSLAGHGAWNQIFGISLHVNKSQMFFCAYRNGLKTYLTGRHGKVFKSSSIILWCCSIPL